VFDFSLKRKAAAIFKKELNMNLWGLCLLSLLPLFFLPSCSALEKDQVVLDLDDGSELIWYPAKPRIGDNLTVELRTRLEAQEPNLSGPQGEKKALLSWQTQNMALYTWRILIKRPGLWKLNGTNDLWKIESESQGKQDLIKLDEESLYKGSFKASDSPLRAPQAEQKTESSEPVPAKDSDAPASQEDEKTASLDFTALPRILGA